MRCPNPNPNPNPYPNPNPNPSPIPKPKPNPNQVAGSGLGSGSRCVAVSADTTDDWCQNACGFISATRPSLSCPPTLCKCDAAPPAADPHVAAYAARAAAAEAAAEAQAAALGAEASDADKKKQAEKMRKNVDYLRAQAKASATHHKAQKSALTLTPKPQNPLNMNFYESYIIL